MQPEQHSSYTGQTMADMKASFNIDIGRLSPTKDVWFRDASFTDASGSATFTEEETKSLTTILSLATSNNITIVGDSGNNIITIKRIWDSI